jgi:phosphoserine phosphatase RsbU/P
MTAVAGDFYWFMAVDSNRVGFLVADVFGHGVPAALVASWQWSPWHPAQMIREP